MIKKISIHNLFYSFLSIHLIIWTLIPTFTNINLPLDTIEALAWGSNLDWGFNKHPPFSALLAEVFFQIFGRNDWAYYLLSQVCVIISFIYIWKLSQEFFGKKIVCISSVLILESFFFYNFTTPEFNVNVCQMPLWSASVYYTWKCHTEEKLRHWFFLGIALSIGFLTKYIFFILIIAIKLFFLTEIIKSKRINLKLFIPAIVFILLLTPHANWLLNNEFITVNYALNRSGVDQTEILDHFINPLEFIAKQLIILIPFLIVTALLIDFRKFQLNLKDKKLIFLLIINLIPLLLILLISLFIGAKIRTMWMSPFYLFFGILFFYAFKNSDFLKNFKKFIFALLFIFILSPTLYLYISITNENKRTDYQGEEIAELVQRKWDRNFLNEINVVVGDEWSAGNLSYHLKSRPKWFIKLEKDATKIDNNAGVIYTGNPQVLKKVCPGVYGTIKPVGYCMIGVK
tara:strand:- start:1386 stop:2759 length:1374 start_codon:yes stop_codon:yes gene_type:complete